MMWQQVAQDYMHEGFSLREMENGNLNACFSQTKEI